MTTTVDTPYRGHIPDGTELDIVLGTRGSEACAGGCGRTLPRLELAAFEIESPEGVICQFCLDRHARPLRLVVLLMSEVLKLQRAGREDEARDAIAAVISGMELIDESRPRPRHERPVRHQPNRAQRRGRRR